MSDSENSLFVSSDRASHSVEGGSINAGVTATKLDQEEASRRFQQNLESNKRFEIVRELGFGGMGVVFEAFDRQQNTRVALKTMIRLQPAELYRFKKEFRTLANIVHPNLVRLYELFSDGVEWFYTMELIDGVDFNTWVRPEPNLEAIERDPTLPLHAGLAPQDFIRLREALAQLTAGVRVLHHEGKLHRDIKPPNILVCRDGIVRLLDFGLIKNSGDHIATGKRDTPLPAKDFAAETLVNENGISGSIAYMAPEQGDRGDLTEASDWYAVGVVLFEALTGRRPFLGTGWNVLTKKQQFDAPDPEEFTPNLPSDLRGLCNLLLSRDPEVRIQALENLSEESSKNADPESTRERAETRIPFFGRETLLEQIREADAKVRQGTTCMLHLRGRSGVGKSALANRFLTDLKNDDSVVVLAGRCYEQESVPYKALDSLVDSVTRHLLSLPLDVARNVIPGNIRALSGIFPVLEQVDAVIEAPARSIADPFELRRVAFDALAQLLYRISEHRHLILYIDDLQWGDDDSARFISELIQSSTPPRMLFLASYRSEYRERSPCLKTLPRAESTENGPVLIEEIEVGPLSRSESEQLARALLTVDRDEAGRIAVESGGNPYFVYELAGLINFEVGHEGRHSEISQLDLDGALRARVRRLGEIPRNLLEIIAVSGKPTPLRYVYDAAEIESPGQPGIALLRSGHLIRRSGPGLDDEIECFHDRIRETIVSHLDRPTLTQHHLGLGRTLEAHPCSDPEAIALHYQGAGEFEAAGNYFLASAKQATQALAFERATSLFRKALQFLDLDRADEREIQVQLGDALANAGRGSEAAEVYLKAASDSVGDPARKLEERAGYQYCVAGRIDEGRKCFARVLKHLGLRLQSSRRAALFSLIRRRIYLLFRGTGFTKRSLEEIPETEINRIDLSWAVAGGITVIDPIPAADFQTHNLILALRAGEPSRISRALAWEGSHTAMVGKRFENRIASLFEEATQLADKLDEPLARGTVDLAHSVASFFLGEFVACREYGDRAAEVFRKKCAGASWELDQSQTFSYWACYWLGDLKGLTERYESLFSSARERGAQLVESQLTTFGGPFVWMARDNPERAREELARASSHWEDVDNQVYHYTALTAKSQIALYEKRNQEALAMVEEEWSLVAGAQLLHIEAVKAYMSFLRGRCAIAVAAENQSDTGKSLKSAAKYSRILKKMRPLWARAGGAQIAAALAYQEGDREKAIRDLETAIAGFKEQNFALHEWSARYQLSRFIDPNGTSNETGKAIHWFRDQGVSNIDAMIRVNAPGFRD